MRRLIILVAFLFLTSLPSFSHQGHLDEKGGHYDRTTGEYHSHRQNSKPSHLSNGHILSSVKEIKAISISSCGKVVKVVDGDTFDVEVGGINQRVRLLNIDAPEVDTTNGLLVKAYVTGLIGNKTVCLKHRNFRDKYGRLLAEVTYDNDKNLSEAIMKYLTTIDSMN